MCLSMCVTPSPVHPERVHTLLFPATQLARIKIEDSHDSKAFNSLSAYLTHFIQTKERKWMG